MRAIVLGLALMVVIAAVAGVGLGLRDQSASSAYTSSHNSVRLN